MSITWNEELIEEKILEVANTFSPVRMPTNSEICSYYGNTALSNKICKSGGFGEWSKRLGLPQKHSETSIGIIGETDIKKCLQDIGFEVETTSPRHPYDLLVNGCVKIDVKTANTSFVRNSPVHSYRIAKKHQTCDFYIFYELDTGKKYVVPSHRCSGQKQVDMGNESTKYRLYLNAFYLIDNFEDVYSSM